MKAKLKNVSISHLPEDSFKIGLEVGYSLSGGEVIFLEGPLGSGKTLMTKGIAKALGFNPGLITSPSFSLLNFYENNSSGLSIMHADFYRINNNKEEVIELGINDYINDKVITIIEWGLGYKDLFSSIKKALLISISIRENFSREIQIRTLLKEL